MCQGSLRGQGKVCLLLDPLLLTWNSRFHLCLGGFLIVKIYLFAFLFPPGDKSRSRCSSNLAKKVAMIWLLTFQHLSRRCCLSPCCCQPSPYSPVLSALSACCQVDLSMVRVVRGEPLRGSLCSPHWSVSVQTGRMAHWHSEKYVCSGESTSLTILGGRGHLCEMIMQIAMQF